MKNPITFSDIEKKYYIWVSYCGIKVMKYFESPEEAADYMTLNYRRCMDIKSPVTQEELKSWLSELKVIPHVEDGVKEPMKEEVRVAEKSSKMWPFIVLLLIIFVVNFLSNPNDALTTLVSSITQAVGLLLIVGVFIAIKKLFKRKN